MRGVPEGWVEVELGQVWRESRTRVQPADIAPTKYIGLKHMESGTNRITGHGSSESVKSAAAVFSPGDVLYGRLRPYLNKVARPSEAGVASTEFLVFEESPALANALLLHLLSSSALVAYASANSAGVNLPRVSAKRLGKYRFPLAPLPEQHRIVAKIESLFAKLDDGVAALKRAEANLERYRASVLKAAVEGTLTEQWRRENPPEETGEELLKRILVERRKRWETEQLAKFEAKGRKPPKKWKSKYKEPVAPDTGGLPELPEGWFWATVDQVTAGNRTSAYGVLKPGSEVPGGIPLVRVGNIQNGVVSGSLKRIAPEVASRYVRTRLLGGELLMTLVGAIGRTAVVPSCLSGANTARAVGVVPVSSLLDPRWLELWFRSPLQRLQMIGKAHEVARKTLNLEDVRSATVALPPISEQRAILLTAEESERGLKSTVEHIGKSRIHAATLRQSTLQRAFEGRLVRQDSADEPASVLLERIQAEREAARKQRKRRSARLRLQSKSRVP